MSVLNFVLCVLFIDKGILKAESTFKRRKRKKWENTEVMEGIKQNEANGKRQENARGDRKFGKKGDEENLSWQTEGTEIAPFIRQRQQALHTFKSDSHGRSHQKQEERPESVKPEPQQTKGACRQWDWVRASEQSEPKGRENSLLGSQKNYITSQQWRKGQTLLLRVPLPSLLLTDPFLNIMQCFSIRWWADATTRIEVNLCLNRQCCRTGWS